MKIDIIGGTFKMTKLSLNGKDYILDGVDVTKKEKNAKNTKTKIK